MIAHRRPEFPARNHFSFSIQVHKANDEPHRSDEDEFITWTEGIKVGVDCFGKSEDRKSGAWARRSTRSYNHRSGSSKGEEFRWLAKEGDESELASPRLWGRAGTPTAPGEQQPASRAQLIARYRQEMLDLVRDMPESDYELSLKDLVELTRTERAEEAAPSKGTKRRKEQKAGPKKGKARSSRGESMNYGVFLLKMFFPFSYGGRRGRSAQQQQQLRW